MQNIKQKEIWMINLGEDNIVGHEQKGNRPFFVISNDEYNQSSKTPIGFFLSTSAHKKTNRFSVETIGNQIGSINTSQIRTISEDRFIRKIGEGTTQELNTVLETFLKEIITK